MGAAIEELAIKKGHELILKIDSVNCDEITVSDIANADLALEFTAPDVAFNNVMKCFDADIPVVCGTTGWREQLLEAENYCLKNNKSFFYSTNFSIGVNLFYELNIFLAKLMNSQSQYDEILLHESHHSGKLDSPSGTAISLANQIISQNRKIKKWVNYKTDENVNLGKDSEGELPIFSTREEDIPGTHIVKYFSDVDQIEIIHKALSREGFALGALSAAEWIIDKKGVFGMKDLLKINVYN